MGGCLLQVHPKGVKLLAGTEEVQDLPIEDILPSIEWRPGVVIAGACIRDPYALLHFSDGSAILLSADSEEGLHLSRPAVHALHALHPVGHHRQHRLHSLFAHHKSLQSSTRASKAKGLSLHVSSLCRVVVIMILCALAFEGTLKICSLLTV